ncbi:AMIN-like domain-containing (lipo)protein [Kitasatospora sp. NPDC054939]
MRRWIIIPAAFALAATVAAPTALASAGPERARTAATATATADGAERQARAVCPTGWGSLDKDLDGLGAQPLRDIRSGQHPCYDRLVLDVPGTSTASPLGYHVRYVDVLYQDGSGKPLPIGGGAILEIVVGAPAYDPETGTPTYPGGAGQPLPGVDLRGYQTFRDAKFASSFEGQSQVGLGVRAKLPFRVFQLDGRLVVDVAHSWTAGAVPQAWR